MQPKQKQLKHLTWSGVFEHKVLVIKLAAIDGLSPGAIVIGEVSTLAHELWYDPMEAAAFEPKALFMCAKTAEVFCEHKSMCP